MGETIKNDFDVSTTIYEPIKSGIKMKTNSVENGHLFRWSEAKNHPHS